MVEWWSRACATAAAVESETGSRIDSLDNPLDGVDVRDSKDKAFCVVLVTSRTGISALPVSMRESKNACINIGGDELVTEDLVVQTFEIPKSGCHI